METEIVNSRALPAERPRMDLGVTREQAEAVAQTHAQFTRAIQYPRDEIRAYSRIKRACQRITLAEQALYTYPRGGETVSGPSIRLAEALAQNWGNLDFGVREIAQADGASKMLAYAIDLETNVRSFKEFTVPHKRFTKEGTKSLDDPRDIYEMTANQGMRRLRACILAVIPGDIVDGAVEECRRTLARGDGEPLPDRVRKMVVAFAALGVPKESIGKRLGHSLDATNEGELVDLVGIYRAIKDNTAARTDFFDLPGAEGADLPDAPMPKRKKRGTEEAAATDPDPATDSGEKLELNGQ